MFFSILKLILILIIVPFFIGIIPSHFVDKKRRSPSLIYVFGFIMFMALFQLIAIPVIVYKPTRFDLIVIIYSLVCALLSIAGLVLMLVELRKSGNPVRWRAEKSRYISRDETVLWAIAVALVVFQMVMFVVTESFDGDDAYYVVESLLSTQTNTLYSIKPYTGLTTGIDLRHALAAVPIWMAYIGRVSGIHSTIVAHSVIGVILIPLLYMIYYQCALILITKDRKKVPIMLIFISFMYIFGNTSIYTNTTFMLTRTWQGKSMLGNIIVMSVIWLLLGIYETDNMGKEARLGYWMCLFGVNIVAAMCSTASVFLIAILIGISGIVLSAVKRNIQIALRLIITCVPLMIYAAMYMLI